MANKTVYLSGIGSLHLQKKRTSRSLRLAFTDSGEVRISLPYYVPFQSAIDFAESKRDWIIKHRPKFNEPLQSGDRIGKAHQLIFKSASSGQVTSTVKNSRVVIGIPQALDPTETLVQEKARAGAQRALKLEAEGLLPQRLKQLAIENDFIYKSVSVRSLKSRWGSCSSKHHIALSYYLMQLPWQLIDYVLLHELTHTRHLNHSAKFWEDLENLVPDLKQKRKILKTHRPTVVANPGSDAQKG